MARTFPFHSEWFLSCLIVVLSYHFVSVYAVTCNPNTDPCDICLPGYYCSPATSTTTKCPCGNSCNASTATPCPVGSYATLGGGTCLACGSSTYCPGSATCVPTQCPCGYSCSAFTATPCPVGSYATLGGGTCLACGSGNYCPGSATCVPKQCPCGNSCSPFTATECPAGSYATLGGGTCLACPLGQYCLLSTCSPHPCYCGAYCPIGSSEPQSCPAGTSLSDTGRNSASDCQNCVAGYYCPQGSCIPQSCLCQYYCSGPSTLTHCGVGMYSAERSTTVAACLSCGLGNYCPARSCSPTVCPIGTYCNSPTLAAPVGCPCGYYCPTIGTVVPILCPVYHWCPAWFSQPIKCPRLYNCNATGLCRPSFSQSFQATSTVCPTSSLVLSISTEISFSTSRSLTWTRTYSNIVTMSLSLSTASIAHKSISTQPVGTMSAENSFSTSRSLATSTTHSGSSLGSASVTITPPPTLTIAKVASTTLSSSLTHWTLSCAVAITGSLSPSTASLVFNSISTQPMGTMSLTEMCNDRPSSVNSSLLIVGANNESLCREYVCLAASHPQDNGGGHVILTASYNDLIMAHTVVLLLNNSGSNRQWLSLLPSVQVMSIPLVTDAVSSGNTLGLLIQRPGLGWPGLELRPFSVQRLLLAISLRCFRNNGSVASHPAEMVLVVEPRTFPVDNVLQAALRSSQGAVGVIGSGGGAEALTMGRLASSLSALACDDVLEGLGAGQGVVSVSSDLLAAVDTIVGNVVFIAVACAAAVLVACGMHVCTANCSIVECCKTVLRLPLSLFPIFATTLPSTVMAIVALLRDVSINHGSAAAVYSCIAVGTVTWGGALFLVGAATRRMARVAILRPIAPIPNDAAVWGCSIVDVVSSVRMVVRSSSEWVAPQSDLPLFEGTTALWYLPLDICSTVVMAVVSALPISHSTHVCVGANATTVIVSAVMLLVAVTRKPFTTSFARVHSTLMNTLSLALALCGLVFVAASDHNMHDAQFLLPISFLSWSVTVLSTLKAVVDVVCSAAATRSRLRILIRSNALIERPHSTYDDAQDALLGVDMGGDDDVDCVMLDDFDEVRAFDEVRVFDEVRDDRLLDESPLPPSPDDPQEVGPLGELLNAYQQFASDEVTAEGVNPHCFIE